MSMQECNQIFAGMAFQVQMTDELLRYTYLGITNISKRAGFGSAHNLYITYKREFGIAHSERFQKIRKERDVE